MSMVESFKQRWDKAGMKIPEEKKNIVDKALDPVVKATRVGNSVTIPLEATALGIGLLTGVGGLAYIGAGGLAWDLGTGAGANKIEQWRKNTHVKRNESSLASAQPHAEGWSITKPLKSIFSR